MGPGEKKEEMIIVSHPFEVPGHSITKEETMDNEKARLMREVKIAICVEKEREKMKDYVNYKLPSKSLIEDLSDAFPRLSWIAFHLFFGLGVLLILDYLTH